MVSMHIKNDVEKILVNARKEKIDQIWICFYLLNDTLYCSSSMVVKTNEAHFVVQIVKENVELIL